jgi:hypothetical protein
MMMPSSTTRLVEPISKAIAAVKCAPLRNNDRASATAAEEQDEEAAPSRDATASVRGRSSPIRRTIVDFRTAACTTADKANPRINAHRTSQVIDPAKASACPIASMMTSSPIPIGGMEKVWLCGTSVVRTDRSTPPYGREAAPGGAPTRM